MENTLSGVRRRSLTFKNISLTKKQKKTIGAAVILVIVLAIIYSLFSLVESKNTSDVSSAASANTATKTQLAKPVATEKINKTFNFDVKDKTGKVITSFQYKIDSAELRDQVVINGSKYQPVVGKTFLILNLEITNNYTNDINIAPKNYVRIMMNNNNEKLAPDLYNDSVDVQAISTKPTSLGLAIDTSAKDIKLQVGEITGAKTTIPLKIKYN